MPTPSNTPSRSFGTYSVSDLMLLVAASSLSLLLMRLMLPPSPELEDFLLVLSFGGPAGLALFGPWALYRNFQVHPREELYAGEWLWIALGAGWIAAVPLLIGTAAQGVVFFAGLMATFTGIPSLIAIIQSLPRVRSLPWTHWGGIVLSLMHWLPLLLGTLLRI